MKHIQKYNRAFMYLIFTVFLFSSGCYALQGSSPVSSHSFKNMLGKRFITRVYIASSRMPPSSGILQSKNSAVKTVIRKKNHVSYESKFLFFSKNHHVTELQREDMNKSTALRGISAGEVMVITDIKQTGSQYQVTVDAGSGASTRQGQLIINFNNRQVTSLILSEYLQLVLTELPVFEDRIQKIRYVEEMYGLLSPQLLSTITEFSVSETDRIYFESINKTSASKTGDMRFKRLESFILNEGPVLASRSNLLIREIREVQRTGYGPDIYFRVRYLDELDFRDMSPQIRTGLFFKQVILPLSERFFREMPLHTTGLIVDLRYKTGIRNPPIIEKITISIKKEVYERFQSYDITAQDLANSSIIYFNDEEMEINLRQIENTGSPLKVSIP